MISTMEQDIFDAVKHGNFVEFMRILNKPDFNPDIINSDANSLLINCVLVSNQYGEEYVKKLLKKNPNLELRNKYGLAALQFASKWSKKYSTEETVRILLEAGANVNLVTNNGYTALHTAVVNSERSSSVKTVKMLLEAGADPNILSSENKIAIEYIPYDLNDKMLLQLLLLRAGSEIPSNNIELIEYRKQELKIESAKYKRKLNDLELELLPDIPNEIKELEKYLKNIKKMIKLRPGTEKVKEIEFQFNEKSKK